VKNYDWASNSKIKEDANGTSRYWKTRRNTMTAPTYDTSRAEDLERYARNKSYISTSWTRDSKASSRTQKKVYLTFVTRQFMEKISYFHCEKQSTTITCYHQ
jgi:hypothetical protein